jgi:hypothetical protein
VTNDAVKIPASEKDIWNRTKFRLSTTFPGVIAAITMPLSINIPKEFTRISPMIRGNLKRMEYPSRTVPTITTVNGTRRDFARSEDIKRVRTKTNLPVGDHFRHADL